MCCFLQRKRRSKKRNRVVLVIYTKIIKEKPIVKEYDWLLFFSPDRADILFEERKKIKAKAGNNF
jgi:hypothetical protein